MTPIRSTGDPDSVDGTAYFVLGGEQVGASVAERLGTDDHSVTVIGESSDSPDGVDGSPTDVRTLEEAGVATASVAVVATESDARNLLIAQLVRSHFDVPRIVVLVNEPTRFEPLEEAGHEPICATSVLTEALVETL